MAGFINTVRTNKFLTRSMTIRPGIEFAADCYVHSTAALGTIHANSAGLVAELNRQITTYYGYVDVNAGQYTPPIYIVDNSMPVGQVAARRDWDPTFPSWGAPQLTNELAAVPVPPNYFPSPGSDAGGIIYKPSTGEYWELWASFRTGKSIINSAGKSVPEWGAAWGGQMAGGYDNLATNRGWFGVHTFPDTTWIQGGTAATSIPQLAGIMTVEEQRRGIINHVLSMAIVDTGNTFVFPAQRTDGGYTGTNAIPEGQMFRFPASLNLATAGITDPYAMMVAKAIQNHGFVIIDTSGVCALSGENGEPPGGQYQLNPYIGPWGIWNPSAVDYTYNSIAFPNSWWPGSRFASMPWTSLIAINPPSP